MEAMITNTSAYNGYVACLDQSQRSRFSQHIQRIQRLSDEAAQTDEFLLAFGKAVAELYAATSVAIWFRDPIAAPSTRGPRLLRKVSIGSPNLGLDEEHEVVYEQLIATALQHPRPLAVQPYSASGCHPAVRNPTDSFVLLGPVSYEQQNVAVLEIALGPKPLRRPHNELVTSYLDWLDWLGQLLQVGLERCLSTASESLLSALETVQQATLQAESMQEQIRHGIQISLQALAGENFGSLKENQMVTRQVRELLESKAIRVQCPECGTAAILRCQKAGNSKTGAFMYDHYLDTGRTFHGGQATFPAVTLVPKPARRQQKR